MRTRKYTGVTMLLAFILTITSPLRAGEADGAVEAVKAYRGALVKGKADAAVSMLATFPEFPPEMARENTEKMIGFVLAGKLKLWIFPQGSKISNDCAVVTVGDGEEPAPDDPFYLIKQDEEWKLLPELTRWKEEMLQLTEEQKTSFAELEAFHDRMRKPLRKDEKAIVE